MKKTITTITAILFTAGITSGALFAESKTKATSQSQLNESKKTVTTVTTTTTTTVTEEDDEHDWDYYFGKKNKSPVSTSPITVKPVTTNPITVKPVTTGQSKKKKYEPKHNSKPKNQPKPCPQAKKSGPKPVDGYDLDDFFFDIDKLRYSRDGFIEIHTVTGVTIKLSPDEFKMRFRFD